MRRQLGRFGLSLVLALVLGPGSTGAQRASESNELDRMRSERRLALVIGNGAYGPRIGPLTNPANDARDIAATLEDLGFAVALELDADRDRMRRAVIDFGLALRDGGIGLFYYSGHAVQLDGVNYLIPLGAEVASESYMPVETVPVDEVLARMGGADNRLNIVILDSCRNNPFKGIFRSASRGLALTPAPTGTYIAYAAAPDALALDGMGGRNSPYTAALLEALEEPGLTLEGVFKRVGSRVLQTTNRFQTPWTGSSITGDFFFRLPEPAPAAEPQVSAPEPPAPAPMIDMVVWDRIEDSQDPADFETFLETYPDSPLAPFARNRLRSLQAARTASLPPPEPARAPDATAPRPNAGEARPEPKGAALPLEVAAPDPASAEAAVPGPISPAEQVGEAAVQAVELALGLSRADWQEMQRALNALGHSAGAEDGLPGGRTRAALAAWQRASGDEPTSILTAAQRERLSKAVRTKHAALVARKPPSPTEVAPTHDCDRLAAWTGDPGRVGPGVAWEDLDPGVAILACSAAVKTHPDEMRFHYQYGRALAKAERLDEAARVATHAAERGYVVAQSALGLLYEEGRGVPKDDAKAASWYRKAAEQDFAEAQTNLGWMYEQGRGVPQDSAQAAAWTRRAVEQGYARAQNNLGWMYERGRGMPQDFAQALSWYRKAAEQGFALAQTNLGWMYEEGRGVPKDDAKAASWYRKAAEQDFAEAQTNLGWMYEQGRGVPQDSAQAAAWTRRAVEQGYARAQNNLGWMYERGRGVPRDQVQAVAWYRKAAAQGHTLAQTNLDRLGQR